ncbi:MAG TPA: alcohol dehydrogenase catalytic domain-containing protein [Thermoleophilaceae bacterium]
MKAVRLMGPEDLRVDDVAEPELAGPGDAIVRVKQTALCGADLFPYHGMTPGFESGTVLGHEFVGVVEAVGDGVTFVKPGQRVVNTSMISDGTCPHCRAGRVTQCETRALFGYSGVYPRLEGGQAELVRIPNANRSLLVIPDGVSDDDAVFLADMLPTGYAGVRRGEVALGDVVVVLGAGTVGLMAVLSARGIAREVIAVDGVPERRSLAENFGATAVTPDQAASAVQAATGGMGADTVIEAAGVLPALDASLELVRPQGIVSVIGAHFEPDYPLNNLLMFEKEITLRFSIGDPTRDRERLLATIEAGVMKPSDVVTHRMSLDEAPDAYKLFDAREATKVVLSP